MRKSVYCLPWVIGTSLWARRSASYALIKLSSAAITFFFFFFFQHGHLFVLLLSVLIVFVITKKGEKYEKEKKSRSKKGIMQSTEVSKSTFFEGLGSYTHVCTAIRRNGVSWVLNVWSIGMSINASQAFWWGFNSCAKPWVWTIWKHSLYMDAFP